MKRPNRKGNTRKNYYITWADKPETTGERKKIKEISTKSKKKYRKKGHSNKTKEKSNNKWEEMTRKHTNKWMQEKPNNFWLKYGDQKT